MISRHHFYVLCLALLPSLGLAEDSVDVSAEGELTPAQIFDEVTARLATIQSLYVSYDNEISFLADEMAVRQYAFIDFYPIARYCSFGLENDKRFYNFRGPGTVAWLLPDVDPRWAAAGLEPLRSKMHPKDMSNLFMSEEEFEKRYPILSKHRRRKQTKAKPEKIYVTDLQSHGAYFFDGEWLREVREDESEAEIIDIDNFDSDYRFLQRDFFFATALVVKDQFARQKRDGPQVRWELEADGFEIVAEAEELDGHVCVVVVQKKDGHRYWLDPQLGYAVRKHIQYFPASAVPHRIWVNDQFREVAPGLWLPQHAVYDRCGPPGAPTEYRGVGLHRHEYTIDKLTVNQQEDVLAAMRFQPGVMVYDDRYKMEVEDGKTMTLGYIMPAEESQVGAAAQKMIAKIEQGRRRASLRNFAKKAFVVGLIAIALVSLMFHKKSTAVTQ